MGLSQVLVFALIFGGLGGFARAIFHYAKKVMNDEETKFDISKALWSASRGAVGGAIAGSIKEGAAPMVIFPAGLTTDVIGKDFFNYIQAYFKDK